MVRRALSPVELEDLKREHVVGIGEAVRLGDEGLQAGGVRDRWHGARA